uniref:Uncharacterized protein n=1 Tax=Physcomitrium patens TaxID=3218 RepID=A0A2K1KDX0_PHYPA|nr:hypothetical protein PHYPA_008350 [Physcomitrium patens]
MTCSFFPNIPRRIWHLASALTKLGALTSDQDIFDNAAEEAKASALAAGHRQEKRLLLRQ